jgi:biopolymer transport protein TolQ
MFTPLSLLIAQATSPLATETTKDIAEKVVDAPATVVLNQASLWSHLLDSDPLVKFTLFVLIVFSVSCWAVIFYKSAQLRAAQKSSQSFWHKFSASNSIADMLSIKSLRVGPMYEIFVSGQQALSKMKKTTGRLSDYHRTVLQQRIGQSKEEEIFKLEQYVSFLATVASTAPFVGLFGTVWGILTAFMAIGKAGSSSLATVGPYIAEALVATAVGLFAAIPAVMAYNYFIGKIRLITKMIDLFIEDFMIKSEQEAGS